MNIEGNPFFWGFTEQRSITTLAKRGNATYNTTRDVVEQKTALDNYFEQNFGQSPNPGFITGFTQVEPMPYIVKPVTPPNDECNEEL